MNNDLTIAVVTRKRLGLLARCLESLAIQSVKPGRVLIVDNDVQGSAGRVAKSFSSKLTIKYVVEPVKGIANARNKALKVNSSRYLAFVDDDCVLGAQWVEEGLRAIKKSRSAYMLGRTELMNKDSLVAKARFYHYQQWFLAKPQGLDTKNVIFDFEILKKHKLKFDNRFNKTSIGGGEDSDMGLQLDRLGLSGGYHRKMVLKHKEPEKVLALVKKAYWSGRAYYLLSKKWQLKDQVINDFRINWKTWLDDFWLKPHSNKELKKRTNCRSLVFHVLVKIYDRAWIEGYLKQEKLDLV